MKIRLGMSEETILWPEENKDGPGDCGSVVEMDEAKYKECLSIQKSYWEIQDYLLTLENEARGKEKLER